MATGPSLRRIPSEATDRRRGFSVRRQLRSLAPLAVIWTIGLLVLLVAQLQTATSLESLVLDPAHLTGSKWYTGALSNLGILIWTSGAVFAVAGSWVARRIGRMSAARFLAVGSLATLLLLLDDVFALHSGPLKRAVGGSKNIAQLLLVFPVAVWLIAFYNDIRRTRSILLFAALAALAGSVIVDIIFGLAGDAQLLVEDGLKLLGILAWSQYFAITSRDIAASAIESVIRTKPVAPSSPTETPRLHEVA